MRVLRSVHALGSIGAGSMQGKCISSFMTWAKAYQESGNHAYSVAYLSSSFDTF